MNDERLGREIRDFYRETDVAPPDSKDSAREVAARLAQVEQVSRRRWRPSWLTRAARHSSLIPASNGHTPTVIGRTTSMLSPVKAITAGAIVFAIGGAFLISQPFGQQGIAPGAEADAVASTWVTGTIEYASSCSGPESDRSGEVWYDRNYECSPQTWTASDPRFSGTVSSRWNEDVHQTDNGFVAVNSTVDTLRNDEGGWVCSSSNLYEGSGLFPVHLTGKTATCVGQGGYEGLSAILIEDEGASGHPFVGVIFSGDFPPEPEPPADD